MKVTKYTEEQIIKLIHEDFADQDILILSPMVKGVKDITGSCLSNTESRDF
jgi:hypothetical protein